MREYHEQLYSYKFDNKFSKTTNYHNSLNMIYITRTALYILRKLNLQFNFFPKKCLVLDDFTGKSHQIVEEKLTPILNNLSRKERKQYHSQFSL